MSAPDLDYRKRPTPIAIPEWPLSRSLHGRDASTNAPSQLKGSGQQPQRLASSPPQQAVCSMTNTPLTSPSEPDEAHLVVSNNVSQAHKHRSSAMTTLSGLMEQARSSPRKSDCGSLPSRNGSTTRSQRSEHSHRSAAAAQAQLEALGEDETTIRSQIESRTEKKLFKMTGQIPPTPTIGHTDPERVFIRTEDLRAQCRAANSEEPFGGDEPTKSPKKKLFGVILPTFSRTPATGTTPAMPSKAAQILGTTPSRRPRRVEPRPIKSARILKTPTKASRSDAPKSLPAKVYGEITPPRPHYSTSMRRRRTTGRRSPGRECTWLKEQASGISSSMSMPPPTPPAKDTPPEVRLSNNPSSPLRRAPSRENLRMSYGDHPNKDQQLQLPFPVFAFSPSPTKTAIHGTGGVSPTKFRPYTAEDYTKLIEGEAMQWPYPEEDEGGEVKEGRHSAPLIANCRDLLQLPLSSHSDDRHYNEQLGHRLSPLPPRFYSPSDRSVRLFKDGESPSQNTDTSRMLFVQPKPSFTHADSHNGSIEMVYQGSKNASESDSPTTQTTNKQISPERDDTDHAARIMQALRNGKQRQLSPSTNGSLGHFEAESSSSKRNNTLNSATPRTESKSEFRVLCPSAVPSPLHKLHGSHVQSPPTPVLRGGNGATPAGLWPSPRTHKTIEDHFFMTNEHLDVVGKTTYDALDMYTKQQISATNAKHEESVVILEKHVRELKSQISLVDEKADDASKQTHNLGLKLEQLETFLKDEVLATITEQAKITSEMQSSMKDLNNVMAHLQQALETLSTGNTGPSLSTASAMPASGVPNSMPQTAPTHEFQPAFTSYCGNEAGRVEQPPRLPLQDRTTSNHYDANGDPRANHSNWQTQAWNGRSSYHGRNRGEASSYAGTNPYHFGNGGQYNNGYMSGYSSYNFSAATSEQPHAYGQKPTQ